MTGGDQGGDLQFRMLGPLEVLRRGAPVPLPSGRAAALLGLLLVHANEALATDRLLEELWRGDPPASAGHALQVYVSNLRKALEPERARAGSATVLVTQSPGYLLAVPAEACDAGIFESLTTEGRRALADGRPAEAVRVLGEALALWRGPVLADLADEPFTAAEAVRLDELRLVATEGRVEGELALGRHAEVAGELETLVAKHPLREHLWAQLILALYRSGRQAEALRAYQRLREGLAEELGLEPSPTLRALEAAVLRHDPALAPPAPESSPPPAPPPAVTAPPLTAPPEEESEPLEEMRVVTALFADLVGSTPLAELLDPEDYALVVSGAVDRMTATTEALGGMVASRMGDGILALFGARATHEDDCERAVRAGLRIVEEIAAYGVEVARSWEVDPLVARAGIDSGPVVVGRPGNGQVLGDALNTAARLQGAARPGGVLCSLTIRQIVGPLFEWGEPSSEVLKGKAEAVGAVEALAARSLPGKVRGLEGRPVPLIGRDGEMAAAARSLDSVMMGTGGVLVVTGEPGAGKSRLLTEVRSRFDASASDGLRPVWLEGRCLSWGQTLAYSPFREMLREWLGVAPTAPGLRTRVALRRRLDELFGPDAPDVSGPLAASLGLPLEAEAAERVAGLAPEALRQASFDAFRSLIGRLAEDGPVVLAVDDLHWADATSLELLEHLLPLTETAALLLVLAQRPERDHGSWRLREITMRERAHRAREVALEPLAEDSAARMLEALLDAGALPSSTAGELLDTADGNPLFIEELVRSLLDAGALRPGDAGWELDPDVRLEIPRTIENVLASRIDRLPAGSRAVLVVAGVLGRQFDLELLNQVSDPGTDVDAALVELQNLGLLEQARRWPTPEYRFHHALTQEAAYRRLVGPRRQELHRRAARALEGLFPDRLPEFHGVLGLHLERAGEPEPALAYYRLAADAARKAHALDEAARQYGAALDVAALVPAEVARRECPSLHLWRGQVWFQQADHRAGDELRCALAGARETGDTSVELLALEELGYAEGYTEGQPGAIARLEEALELAARMGDGAAGVSIRSRLTVMLANHLELDRALAVGEEALAAARKMGDEQLVARAMDGLKLVALVLGDYPALRALASEIEDILARQDEPWYLMWTLAESSSAWAASGDWAEAWRRLDEAQRLGEQIGDRVSVPFILTTRAWLERARGRYDQAVPLARTAIEAANDGRHTQMKAWTAANLGAILAELGELGEAIERLEEGRKAAERGGIRIPLARIRAHLASARQRSGAPAADDLAAAEELLGQVRPPPGKCFLYGLDAYVAVAAVHLAAGDVDAATTLLTPLLAASESAGWREGVARTTLALGECAVHRDEPEEAADLFGRSLEVAGEAGLAPLEWQAHAALARLARRRGDEESARVHRQQARVIVDGLATSIPELSPRRTFTATARERLDG